MPSSAILLAVWFLSLTTQRSKFLPHEVQGSLLYSFGCYLMSLMVLNVFVLRKFLWFFELNNFYIIIVNILLILSKYRLTLPSYRIKTNFAADCFNRKFSFFCYYEFSCTIFWLFCKIAHFCCCFCFFCKLSHYLTI